MGRQKKYKTEKSLRTAVGMYFQSISRTVTLTEKVPTGRKDKYGHMTFKDVPVKNDLGEEIRVVEYLLPPTISALCVALGISRETWHSYSLDEKLSPVCREAKERVEAWLEEQLLSRRKGLEGVKFNLENNFDWSNKHRVDNGNQGVEKYLETLQPGQNEF